MTERSRQARDERGRHAPPDAGRRFGAPPSRMTLSEQSPAVPSRAQPMQPQPQPQSLAFAQAQPLQARFGWRPDATDFPVALIVPAVRRVVTLAPELPWYVPASEHGRRLPKRALPPVFAIVVIAGALATRSLWDDRAPLRREHSVPAATVIVVSSVGPATATTGSLFVQPGAVASPTPVSPTATVDTRNGGVTVVRATGAETLLDIAARHGLRVVTLVWANEINDPAAVVLAETPLIVPPVDGIVVHVVEGDTLASIAARYGVRADALTGLASNGLQTDSDLLPGLTVCVPGGVLASRPSASTHAVLTGETLARIADWYGLSPETIAFANELPGLEQLSAGQELVIPPANGVYVHATDGVTVEALAEHFGAGVETIRAFALNGLPGDTQPVAGQPIMLAGVAAPSAASQTAVASTTETVVSPDDATVVDPFAAAPADGFAWPTHGYIAQEFSAQHSGLDIANLAGTPVVAAAAGTVTFAGWSDYGLGYAVAIDHGHGLVTWYGHLGSVPAVRFGQQVAAGQYLGPMGSSGNATAPRLHFIVIQDGAYLDPLTKLP